MRHEWYRVPGGPGTGEQDRPDRHRNHHERRVDRPRLACRAGVTRLTRFGHSPAPGWPLPLDGSVHQVGETVAGVTSAGQHFVHDVQVTVQAELYFETGDLS